MQDLQVHRIRYIAAEIIAFTERPLEAQLAVLEALGEIVTASLASRDIREQQRLLHALGSSVTIALLGDLQPADIHLQLALGLAGAVAQHNEETANELARFELRLALEESEDITFTDVTGQTNTAGAGISSAATVLSGADARQLLLAPAAYDRLQRLHKYQDAFTQRQVTLLDGPATVYQYTVEDVPGISAAAPRRMPRPEPDGAAPARAAAGKTAKAKPKRRPTR